DRRSVRRAMADSACAAARRGAGGPGLTASWMQRWARPGQARPPDIRLDLLWLLCATLVLVASGIGLRDPWPADEPRFVLIAREMIASGDWLIPRIAGELYAEKPPLYFWLMALALKATGS